MTEVLKKRRTKKSDRRVKFSCGHEAFRSTGSPSLLDWKKTKCPTCESGRIVSEQGPESLENLFRF